MNTEAEKLVLRRYKSECEKFEADNNYRKALAVACGLDKEDYYFLRPIIGQNEFAQIVETLEEKNFMPGVRLDKTVTDSHNDDFIKSGDFRANLHIHTNISDGVLSIDEFLEESVSIANRNYSLNPKEPPFLVAITDHDCIDGAREVARKVAQNPIKYRNVRIVLGTELSVISNRLNNLRHPLLIHMHVFCLNPFDAELQKLVDKKIALKKQLAHETIGRLNFELKEVLARFDLTLTLEEAAKIHELVVKGQDEVYIPMKKYIGAKLLFELYISQNQEMAALLRRYGIDKSKLRYEEPYKKYKYIFKNGGSFLPNYQKALKLYIKEFLPNNSSIVEFEQIIDVCDEMVEAAYAKTLEIIKESHPTLNNMPEAFYGFEDTLYWLQNQDFGVCSIAHPARTVVKSVESSLEDLFENMFDGFKVHGKDKALFYEGYYQSYNGENYLEYLPHIEKAAQKRNLIKVGGLDTHGVTITRRGGIV